MPPPRRTLLWVPSRHLTLAWPPHTPREVRLDSTKGVIALAVALALVACAAPSPSASTPSSSSNPAEIGKAGTILIANGNATGTGAYLGKGLVVTAAHVVAGAMTVEVSFANRPASIGR